MFFFVVFFFLLAFVYIFVRLSCGITRCATCLVGKTALVTGANSGLGYQTVLNLASRGCRVIMADVSDMEESKSNIIKYTNNTDIITKHVDLSSLKSVRDFAVDIKKTENRLDILINNAGIGISLERRTKDGLQPAMQINYFSHFLLTHLLIDLLKKSTPSRIVFTSSFYSFLSNLSLHNLNSDEEFGTSLLHHYRGMRLYGNSKLAVLIASDIFAEKLKGTGVTSNSIHPGLIPTQIFTKIYGLFSKNFPVLLFWKCLNTFFSKDPWEGSQTLVHAAVAKELENVSGNFFADCRPFVKPWQAYNRKLGRDIWEASEKFVGLELHEKL